MPASRLRRLALRARRLSARRDSRLTRVLPWPLRDVPRRVGHCDRHSSVTGAVSSREGVCPDTFPSSSRSCRRRRRSRSGRRLRADAGSSLATPVAAQASMRAGSIKGVVRDDAGQAVRGVEHRRDGHDRSPRRGATRAAGSRWRCRPANTCCAPRARATSRRIASRCASRAASQLERDITLTRQGVRAVAASRARVSGRLGTPPAEPPRPSRRDGDRHRRSRAQRGGVAASASDRDRSCATARRPMASWRRRRRPVSSRRARRSSIAPSCGSARSRRRSSPDTDFDGQVNFLTTSALSSGTRLAAGRLAARHRVRGRRRAGRTARRLVGCAAPSRPATRRRGCCSASTRRTSRRRPRRSARRVVQRAGLRLAGRRAAGRRRPPKRATSAASTATIAGASAPRSRSTTALRLDRYDYVASPNLVSPRRRRARRGRAGHVSCIARAARWMIAPGADEFLPPSTSGPWLPPERTFSSLVPREPARAERVRHYEVGVEQRVRRRRAGTASTFSGSAQSADRSDRDALRPRRGERRRPLLRRDAGQRRRSTAGALRLDGVTRARFDGTVDYTAAVADWDARPAVLGRAPRRAVGRPRERRALHDLDDVARGDVPETPHARHAGLSLQHRVQSAPTRRAIPDADGRFDLEVRQALPYRPLRRRPARRDRSPSAPSARSARARLALRRAPDRRAAAALMGGVQVRF